MAISPKQAQELAGNQIDLKGLEARIDAILVSDAGNHRFTTISRDFFPNIQAIEIVTQTYNDAGWNVKYNSDQRDGDYISFTRKTVVKYGGDR